MINPLEAFSRLVSSTKTATAWPASVSGSFTAPEDLTLREVRMTAVDINQGPYLQLVTFDPDLTQLPANEVLEQFQLLALTDPLTTRIPQLTVFQNLSVPLLKGQTIYWAGADADIFQLIFS